MSKQHLKRLNAPKSWPISRKGTKWVTRQNPGTHGLDESVSINIMLKDMLKYARTTRDARRILNNREVLIDNIPRKDVKFPVGIFDVIKIPKTKECFLMLLNKKGILCLNKIDEKKSELKHLKIIEKTILKKGKMQVNFYNGNNMLVDKNEYKVGDTLVLSLKDKNIVKHLKMEEGATVYLTKGKHVGSIGVLKKVLKSDKSSGNNLAEIKIDDKNVKTLKEYVFVIDKSLI